MSTWKSIAWKDLETDAMGCTCYNHGQYLTRDAHFVSFSMQLSIWLSKLSIDHGGLPESPMLKQKMRMVMCPCNYMLSQELTSCIAPGMILHVPFRGSPLPVHSFRFIGAVLDIPRTMQDAGFPFAASQSTPARRRESLLRRIRLPSTSDSTRHGKEHTFKNVGEDMTFHFTGQ